MYFCSFRERWIRRHDAGVRQYGPIPTTANPTTSGRTHTASENPSQTDRPHNLRTQITISDLPI